MELSCRERLWGSEELWDGALLLFGSLIRRRSEAETGALGGESALDSMLDGATLWACCLGELRIVCEARQLAWPHEVAVEAVKGGAEIAGTQAVDTALKLLLLRFVGEEVIAVEDLVGVVVAPAGRRGIACDDV